MTMTVGIGYVEVEGKGELVGRGTERTHVVRLADVVAGVRRVANRRRQPGSRSCSMQQAKRLRDRVENAGIIANCERRLTPVKLKRGAGGETRGNMRT